MMILETLEGWDLCTATGSRRIEQTAGGQLNVQYGTVYPALLKLEQEGVIAAEWGVSENNRKAKFYTLSRAGVNQLKSETQQLQQTAAIMSRFFTEPGGAS
jgi:PadR family transcriptional regulator, regulatory protein PadR